MVSLRGVLNKGTNIKTVSADARQKPDYTKLSDALTAITDASASNRYTIYVYGPIADTAQCTAKPYIDVIGLGAFVTVTSNAAVHAAYFHDVTNSIWDGISLNRVGTSATNHLLTILFDGTTDDTCIYRNAIVQCDIVAPFSSAITVWDSSFPTLENLKVIGAENDHVAAIGIGGLLITDAPHPRLVNVVAVSRGNSSTLGNNSGIVIDESACPTLVNCDGYASDNGTGSGIAIQYCSHPTLIGCRGYGSTVMSSQGLYIDASATPTLINCVFEGRAPLAGSDGVFLGGACSPHMVGCVGRGSPWHTSCHGIQITSSSCPVIDGGEYGPKEMGYEWYYDDVNNGRFVPFTSVGCCFISCSVQVLVANAGKTLSIGTSPGSTNIATGIDLGTVGSKIVSVTRQYFWVGGYFYATPSGAVADNSFKIRYTVVPFWDDSYGCNMTTVGDAKINGAILRGNGHPSSCGLKVYAAASSAWTVSNCEIGCYRPTLAPAVIADAFMSGAQIVNCLIHGTVTNVTGLNRIKAEHFQDCLAASATAIRSNEDLSEAVPNTLTLDAQPDIPRKLTWAFDSHAQITAFTIIFTGVNAKDEVVTQTITEASGWTGTTNEAFATVNSIIMTARTGTGAGDTLDIGTADKIGLVNVISAAASVYKVKKNNANLPASSYTAEAVYGSVDLSTGGAITGGDDFTIWYKVP